ncbi:ATP-binding protein, partial [Rhodoferax sp.]|uniref:sensor histidine kinase n=1 Tax=Rhodoferax sp. TaxID=50421 RepID=UPI00374D3820
KLTRSLLWALGLVWVVVACSSAWYAQVEINEGMDNALMDTGHRLLDLAIHDLKPPAGAGSAADTHFPLVQRGDTRIADDYLMYQVVDVSGRVLLRSQDAPDTPFAAGRANGFSTLPPWRVYTYQHPELPYLIHIADSMAHRREAQWEITLWLLLPVLGVLPILALLIRFITRRHLAPLQHISLQIGQRNGRNLSPIAGTTLAAELQTITDSMNHLLLRLGDALDTEKALAANAAHELRTPLATTMLRLHTLLNTPLVPVAKEEAFKALESLQQLSRRTEKLLQMSRAESSATLAWNPVNLAVLAGTVAQEFWAQTEMLDRLYLRLPADLDVVVSGDFDALAIVLRNLVENALRYGRGAPVDIEVVWPATLVVRDFGPGVPAETLALIRQRHVKNTPDATGYGLGMSIVSTVVERHRGRLVLVSPLPGRTSGFEASVVLQADESG